MIFVRTVNASFRRLESIRERFANQTFPFEQPRNKTNALNFRDMALYRAPSSVVDASDRNMGASSDSTSVSNLATGLRAVCWLRFVNWRCSASSNKAVRSDNVRLFSARTSQSGPFGSNELIHRFRIVLRHPLHFRF